jgi:hypothetical protein
LDGLSVGGADIKRPREEKQKAAIMVPASRLKLNIPIPNKIVLIIKMKKVINRPNIREATISPRIIAHNVIGAETNLSKVFILVSQGAITGPMDETVTKSAMPTRPGIKKVKERFLPKAKAINKKDGISIPDITTGPFK